VNVSIGKSQSKYTEVSFNLPRGRRASRLSERPYASTTWLETLGDGVNTGTRTDAVYTEILDVSNCNTNFRTKFSVAAVPDVARCCTYNMPMMLKIK
jgi:hypothetical protein